MEKALKLCDGARQVAKNPCSYATMFDRSQITHVAIGEYLFTILSISDSVSDLATKKTVFEYWQGIARLTVRPEQ